MTDIIRIRYGRHGMGHAVRMGRLANVLQQRGAVVDILPYGEDSDPLYRFLKANPGGTLVLDRSRNSNAWLSDIRPYVDRLVIVVGVGHAVTLETQWVADLVLYQNARQIAGPRVPGSEVWHGASYLMLDQCTATARKARKDAGHGIAVYFGAGFPHEYGPIVVSELHRLLPGVLVEDEWQPNPLNIWKRVRLLVASMGMSVYEAVAAGAWTVCVSVDDEHAEDADAMTCGWGIWHLGQLQDVPPETVALQAAEIYSAHGSLPAFAACDGLGIYRVANWILDR